MSDSDLCGMSDGDLVRYMVDGEEDAHTTLIDGNGLQSDGGWHQRCSETIARGRRVRSQI
ncbi:hypothetical protein ACHAWO_007101 [Cyclotella atomus]|uniref:Uncharacterized protein n=1 Tax=Cyclotella atomus TaxID=382360 RepID=A0ABD3QLG4_9STRA